MAETIKGLTIKIGSDTKEFQKGINAANKDIKETQKQADALTKSLQLEFDAGRFAQAQRLAQDAIEKTEQKAQALRDQMKYLEETGTDKSSLEYKKLETQLIQTETQAVSLREKLKEINNLKLNKLAEQVEGVGKGFSTAGKALMPFSALATGAIAGITAIGKTAISTADNISTLATQVGLSAEELQKWQYIAMQTDVTDSQLQTGLTKIQSAIADLATGTTSNATKALEQLGISAEDAAKGMNYNFDTLIKRLSSIEDPILQASYANELFGDKLGSKLIPLLQAGGIGVATLAEEFESLNYLTNEQVQEFAEFDNVMNKIKYQFENIKNQLGYAILPLMQDIAGVIEEKVIPLVQRLSDFIGGLSTRQLEMIMKISAVIAVAGPLLVLIGKIATGIGSIIKLIPVLNSGLSALSAHPIVLVIGVIAGLLLLLYNRSESVREVINRLVSVIGGTLSKVLDSLLKTLQPIMDIVMTILEILLPIIDVLFQPLIRQLQMLEPLLKIIGSLAEALGGIFGGLGNIVKGVFGTVIGWINNVVGWIEDIINWCIDKINFVIRALNNLPFVDIDELGEVSLRIQPSDNGSATTSTSSPTPTYSSMSDYIQESPLGEAENVTNYDYSTKDININVVVNNYGEEIDTDKLIQDINIKLAEQM